MFRIKLSKLRQVLAVAIIPRILVRDSKLIKNKINTYDVYNSVKKSTDSGSKDDEIEKQRQIIEKCFGETPQSTDLKDDSSEIEKEHGPEAPSVVQLSDAEKCDESKASDGEAGHVSSGIQADEATVQATTANIAEETLQQKVERIDETPHVEASPQKIEGFNSTPKVLGHDIEFFAEEKIQQIDLDDLAKRCVGAPIGNIDEMLIKEMKNMANNDQKTQPDMNIVKSHSVEKYYSGIFEHLSQQTKETKKVDDTTKPLNIYNDKYMKDKEIKSEHITPLHTDSVHLFAYDEGSRDYKETGFYRDSSVHLSSDIEEPLLDLPSIITPYESPAIPFYEYVNKEHIILDDLDESEATTAAETSTDISKTGVFLKKESSGEPSLAIEKHEMDPAGTEPTLSHSAEAILGGNLKDNIRSEFGNLSQEQLIKLLHIYKIHASNKTAKSHVFTTSSNVPSGDQINPAPNSAISATMSPELPSKEGTQSLEMPENTAISANQNPGEYYSMSFLNKELALNLSEQLQTISTDSHFIQSFCTQLEKIEDGVSKDTDDTIKILEYPIPLRDPFSYILLHPDIKQDKPTGPLTDKITPTTNEMLTDSLKTGADDGEPLSQVLKRIRNKNRLEFCRSLLLQSAKEKATKKFTCITPLDRSKPKTTLTPSPCQPPPKPPKVDKCPKPCPPPCPPKKDPCAKLIPFFLNSIIRLDMSFDMQIPKRYQGVHTYKSMLTDDIIERLRKLGERLSVVQVDQDTNNNRDATCARDFEPWIPIPSWPAPRVDKKRPFVCPKEGCKPVQAPPGNPPKQRPCLGVPKKSFSFSAFSLKPVNTPDIIYIDL